MFTDVIVVDIVGVIVVVLADIVVVEAAVLSKMMKYRI